MIHVAIVEDDSNYQKELKQYLSDYEKEHAQAFRVDVFSDGDEITQDYREDYDIIFMDIQMPIMNGYEATRIIRNSGREDLNNIPILAMTANALAQDVRAALNSGMNQHISKPLDLNQLYNALEKWLK